MKILLFFHGGSKNRGCEAIVRTVIKVIKSKHNDIYIALASTEPETDREIAGLDEIIFHNQNRGFKRFSFPYFQNLFETRIKKTYNASYRLMHQDIISRIDDFDVFLSIGGDNYCYGDLPDYYELDRQIKAKGKKLILWGASLGKENVTTQNKQIDLNSFDALLIRETKSLEELQQLGLKNAHLVADGAFVLDKEFLSLPEKWQESNTIGFNYSPLIFKRHPESRKAAKGLLEYILEKTDYQIAFTPHVVIPGNDDYQCMQELMSELDNKFSDRIFLLPDDLNAMEYKGYISRMELFIGARTHATIAAYSSKVPTMVLGYSIKSLGIAKDIFGYERLVLDKSEIGNAELLIAKFEELQKDKEEIKAILETKIPEIQRLSFSAADYL